MPKEPNKRNEKSSKKSKKSEQKNLKKTLIFKTCVLFLATVVLFIALQIIMVYPRYPQVLKNFWLFKGYMASDWMNLIFNSVSITLSIALTYIVYKLDKKSQDDRDAEENQKNIDREAKISKKEKQSKLIAATQWATALQFQKIETEIIVDSSIYNNNIISKFKNTPNEVYAIYLTSNVTFPFHLSININKITCKLWYLYDGITNSRTLNIKPICIDDNEKKDYIDDSFYTLNAINGNSIIEIYIRSTDEVSEHNKCLSSLKDFSINEDHLNTIEMEISANISDESGLYFNQPFDFTLNITGITDIDNNIINVIKTKYKQKI